MKTSLIVMAAGLASRYGGSKQTEGMGPHGEILMEYSVHDAIRAGFDRVVFVIRPELRETVGRLCGDRFEDRIEVAYACQDFAALPAWYRVPEGRAKPYGTVHAVLCARGAVDGPFAVINADDYYGVEAFGLMRDFLASLRADDRAAMMGYRLENTVSAHGDVTRGLCRVVDGCLASVEEIKRIRLFPDGTIAENTDDGPGRTLDPQAQVSMNFWGFPRGMMDRLQACFEDFLKRADPGDLKSEALLPEVVDRLVRAGELSVRVIPTHSAWFGVTYQEDRPRVQQALRALHDAGVYGENL